jgi:hypothetical protein
MTFFWFRLGRYGLYYRLLKAARSSGVDLAVQCEQLIRPDVDHR